MMYPIKKEPKIFTESVPYILVVNRDLLKLVKQNLKIAPVAPPEATKNIFNNVN